MFDSATSFLQCGLANRNGCIVLDVHMPGLRGLDLQEALAKVLVTHPAPQNVRAWVHSHARLGVFWSQQDEACIEGLANDACLISIVVNKKREFKARIDVW